MNPPHLPVLLKEVLQVFEGLDLKVFFEGTVGAGGHAKALLESHREIERYLACDRDPKALQLARASLEAWGEKVEWILGPFGEMGSYLDERGITALDGCLFDFGLSSMQLEDEERGFSFRLDAPLDMRMGSEEDTPTAADLVNELPEAKLAQLFYEYGEERRSRQAAKAIVDKRRRKPIRTTRDLLTAIEPVLMRGRGKIHPATRIFQALRIAVNEELKEIEQGLSSAIDHLRVGGRLVAISFHSLEDRIAKRKFKDSRLRSLSKKPIVARIEERRKNPRSRSAKLRAVEKVTETKTEERS